MINLFGKDFNEVTFDDVKKAISEQDLNENLFIEFKSSSTKNNKISKEVAAFANTYGGYLFIGIEDDNLTISGCGNDWTEERINNIIYSNIVPAPIINIKKLNKNNVCIFIVKIEEGIEPPYVANNGNVYIRNSSSSAPVKDVGSLNLLYEKKIENKKNILSMISIDDITDKNDILGSIDVGFRLFSDNRAIFNERISSCKLQELYDAVFKKRGVANIRRQVGSIYVTMNSIATKDSDGNDIPTQANLSNFMEIMADGSCRFRLVLLNNDKTNSDFDMYNTMDNFICFEKIYQYLFKDIIQDTFIYALKKQKLNVYKQFKPYIKFENNNQNSISEDDKDVYFADANTHNEVLGKDCVVTNDSIPKFDFEKIDKKYIELVREKFSSEDIIGSLFSCHFLTIAFSLKSDC